MKGEIHDKNKLSEEEALLLGKQAEDRSRIYMLLSIFYMHVPGENIIRMLRSNEFIQALRIALLEDNKEMTESLKILEMFVNSMRDIPESEVIEDLAVDFTRLFRGIKEGYGPPPPYESVWRGEGRVMGEWTQKVIQIYSEAGIGIDMAGELPDYIGVELKFMSLLSYREAEAWRKNDIPKALRFLELQRRFMDEHVRQWVTEFCDKIEEVAASILYKGIAMLTKSFLGFDAERIEEIFDIIN